MYTMLLLGSGRQRRCCLAGLLADFTSIAFNPSSAGFGSRCDLAESKRAYGSKKRLNRQRAKETDQLNRTISTHWREYVGRPGVKRFLWTVGVGTCAFNMQDIILEPYGGQVLHLGVGATSLLNRTHCMWRTAGVWYCSGTAHARCGCGSTWLQWARWRDCPPSPGDFFWHRWMHPTCFAPALF
jgi:hypothetical protein